MTGAVGEPWVFGAHGLSGVSRGDPGYLSPALSFQVIGVVGW